MNTQLLRQARATRGWTQVEAARRLGVSQPYLAMLEAGKRPLTTRVARRAVRVYGLPTTVLPAAPVAAEARQFDNQTVAEALARLGYPGMAYLRGRRRAKNPAEVLLASLRNDDLEPRLTEGLVWLLLHFGTDFDNTWLVSQARLHNVQNRLGFLTTLARRVAESSARFHQHAEQLWQLERELESSRLAAEDTLCEASLPEAKRRWLAQNRLPEAAHWNLLTNWRPEHFRYVN